MFLAKINSMKEFWNERFAMDEFLYGEDPNPLFKEFIDVNKRGKILLPGEGEGRNAVYAAMRGWDVYAIDQSEEGKRKAELLAEKNKITINYDIGDILKYPYEPESFDVIAMVFLHLPSEQRISIHQHLTTLLKKGGRLFVIGFF